MKHALTISALSASVCLALAAAIFAADPATPSTAPASTSTAPASATTIPTVEVQLVLLAPGSLSSGFGQSGLRLLIKNAGGIIMGPPAPLTVTRFEDDLGNPLFNSYELASKFPKGNISIAPDRETATVTLTGKNRPASTATKIFLEGALHLTLGNDPKTFSAKNVRVQYGFEFQAGEQKFAVESLSDLGLAQNWTPGDTMISFQTKPIAIADARLFTTDNKLLGHSHPRTLDPPDPRNPDRGWAFVFEVNKPGKTVNFEVDICQQVTTVDCPIKIEAPLVFKLGKTAPAASQPRIPPSLPPAAGDLP